MLMMRSALIYRVAGFVSFLRFIRSIFFPELFFFILSSLPNFETLVRSDLFYIFLKSALTIIVDFTEIFAKSIWQSL